MTLNGVEWWALFAPISEQFPTGTCLKDAQPQREAAFLIPERLRFPKPLIAMVEFLDDPGQLAQSALRHDDAQFRMAVEDAPGKEIDERIEKLLDE